MNVRNGVVFCLTEIFQLTARSNAILLKVRQAMLGGEGSYVKE